MSTAPLLARGGYEPGHGDEDQRHNNYNVYNSAHCTPPGKRRRRQEPGHGDEDHGGTSNNQMLFPLIENKPVENNYNVFHSARNNRMAQGPKSGSHIKGQRVCG